MAKTIQVRVDDRLKESADSLFSSLGLDTSTAIRMFLVAAIDSAGIPFAVGHGVDRDSAFRETVQSPSSKLAFGRGCMKGKIQMADDFDAPLDDFKEYME